MARRKVKAKTTVHITDPVKEALRVVLEAQKRKDIDELVRQSIQRRKDEAHVQLAARILRYKFSFAPNLTYERLSEAIGTVDANYLNQITLRYKYLSDKAFELMCERMDELEKQHNLAPMPQKTIKG